MTSSRAWTEAQLEVIGRATELRLASHRADGTLRPAVTIWVVRLGNDIFVRSGYGRSNPWFMRARRRMSGQIEAAGSRWDVTFEEAPHDLGDAITAAYHEKYDAFGARNVDPMVAPDAVAATLRLLPGA